MTENRNQTQESRLYAARVFGATAVTLVLLLGTLAVATPATAASLTAHPYHAAAAHLAL